MREQALGNAPQTHVDGDKSILVLERQPPLSKITLVCFVIQDKVYNDERALVSILAYGKDQAYVPDEGSLDLGQGLMLSF